jgi:hypothetical protein
MDFAIWKELLIYIAVLAKMLTVFVTNSLWFIKFMLIIPLDFWWL